MAETPTIIAKVFWFKMPGWYLNGDVKVNVTFSRGIAEVPENVSDNGSVAEIAGEQGPEISDLPSPVLGQVSTC
jgi:hypothetical protein